MLDSLLDWLIHLPFPLGAPTPWATSYSVRGLTEHNRRGGCNTILLFSSSHPFEVWTVYPSFLVAYDTLTMWLINHFWYVFIRFPPFLFLVIHFVWILFLRFFGRNPLLSFPLFVLCSWFSSVLPIGTVYIRLSPKVDPALPTEFWVVKCVWYFRNIFITILTVHLLTCPECHKHLWITIFTQSAV